ncbi:MAG: peptidoglycan DD-metalloendopeptidase family protein [Vicinamibacterales bacterium]
MPGLGLRAQTGGPPTARPGPGDRAAERIKVLQQEADQLATQERGLLTELRRFEVQRQLKTAELRQIEAQRAVLAETLAASSARTEALRQAADAERPEIQGRLVRVYRLGKAGFWRLLLDVDDLRTAARAYRTAAALTRIDHDRVVEHQRMLDTLAREQADLQQRVARLGELETSARSARAAADTAVAGRTALVASIDARRDLNAQLTSELQAAQLRLQVSIEQLAPGSAPVTLPVKAFRGALPWPARGRLLVRFGAPAGTRGGAPATWNGLSMALLEGQTVRAVHEGTVVYADVFAGYGDLVIVEHGDRSHSLYGYLSSLAVSRGDRIEAQAPVGASGVDPSGTPALYFELRIDGQAVDPLQWLVRE